MDTTNGLEQAQAVPGLKSPKLTQAAKHARRRHISKVKLSFHSAENCPWRLLAGRSSQGTASLHGSGLDWYTSILQNCVRNKCTMFNDGHGRGLGAGVCLLLCKYPGKLSKLLIHPVLWYSSQQTHLDCWIQNSKASLLPSHLSSAAVKDGWWHQAKLYSMTAF